MNIALALEQKDYVNAVQQIEALIAQCCPDDGLIDAALAVRKKLGGESISPEKRVHPSISLCMVVKNELAGIGACLHGAKRLVDEIVVVDTGSNDRTKDVALIFGAKVFDFKWCDDFAAARNYSLEKARGDWVLILDADEIIAAKDHEVLKAMLKQNGNNNLAYNIVTRNYTHLTNVFGWYANDGNYDQYEAGTGWFPTSKVRLFPRKESIRFRFPVHERVDPDIISLGMTIVDCSVPVHHYGHLNEDKRQKKAQKYFQLGYAKLERFGDDLHALRELAVQAGQLELWKEAAELWQRFIDIKPNYAEAYVNLAGIYWQMGSYENALAAARSALEIDGHIKEASYNVAISLLFLGKTKEAIAILKQLLSDHKEYLPARFMLAAAFSFLGELKQSAQELLACRAFFCKETLSLAVQNLAVKLESSKLHAHSEQLKMALAICNENNADKN